MATTLFSPPSGGAARSLKMLHQKMKTSGRWPIAARARKVHASPSRDLGHNKTQHSDFQTFRIACGSSGYVTVDIYNSHALQSKDTPLIVHLPPTGTHFRSQHEAIPPYLLSNANRDVPLASINYRWNHAPSIITTGISSHDDLSPSPPLLSSSPGFTNHPFPIPIHDILHGYSWLTETFLPSISKDVATSPYPSPPPTPSRPKQSRPLLIYGSHLGGTLATSLALTESLTSRFQNRILGLIVSNSPFDWTSTATSLPPSPLTTFPLPSTLFAKPSACFDSFASPILFFRSPGTTIPLYFPGQKPKPPESSMGDVSGLSLSPAEIADLEEMLGREKASEGEETKVEVVRKSMLRFPPKDSALKIPRSLFLVRDGPKNKELLKQTAEIVKLMRRSIVKHEFKDRVQWDEELDPHAVSEERVQTEVVAKGLDEGIMVRQWIEDLD